MTKKKPKDERIGDIIQSAIDEFLEKGFDDTSMEAIARRAGISKGGIYHHFKSKDEILLLANRKMNEPIARMMHEANSKPSPVEGLSWYIQNYLIYWEGRRKEMIFYSLSMTKLLDSPELWQMYERYIEGTIEFFKSLYDRGIATGEFISHSSYESALTLMAALDGIAMYLTIDSTLNLDEVTSIYMKKFVHAFQTRKSSQQKTRKE